MQDSPNQNQYAQQFFDQLNKAPNRRPLSHIQIALLAGAAFLLLVVSVSVISLLLNNTPKINLYSTITLSSDTETLANTYRTKLRDTNLRAANSSLIASLSNFNREITTYYSSKATQDQSKQDKELSKQINIKDATIKKLENAELINQLDRQFMIEITYLVQSIVAQQIQIFKQAKDDRLRQILEQSLTDLNKILDQLSNIKIN